MMLYFNRRAFFSFPTFSDSPSLLRSHLVGEEAETLHLHLLHLVVQRVSRDIHSARTPLRVMMRFIISH